MNGHIVAPFHRRPELFRSANHRHALSGWGEAPLVIGADDLEVLVNEDWCGQLTPM